MIQKLKFALKYFIFWLGYFFFARLFFLIYNIEQTKLSTFGEIIGSMWHGLKLDLSMTGYLSFFILLFLSISVFCCGKAFASFIKGFTAFFIALFSLVNVSDAELYRNWGFKMDNTIFFYLKTPTEAFASSDLGRLVLLTLCIIVITYFFIWLYNKYIHDSKSIASKSTWYAFPVIFILAGSMIIPVRGGFGIAPINTGTVYFSNNQYVNHAAVNTCWNLGQSAMQMGDEFSLNYMPQQQAQELVQGMNSPKKEVQGLLTTDKPNILLIILESFTANIIEPLGGTPDVTKNFNELCKEGLLFTNFTANGDRSDKGIASILSAYPAQPTTSIIKYNGKSGKLPHLSNKLMNLGYSSAFYYGGELNFANMQSYFLNGKYEELITLSDFSESTVKGKWGAHDEVVFDRLAKDLIQPDDKPFFKVFFTLSSHDPFKVPFKGEHSGAGEEARYLNSANYTDSCLGDFMMNAKNEDWFKDTWIILLADHGNRLPGNVAYNTKAKFNIPMLWLGGAVNSKDTLVTEALNQMDLPLMIGNQLGEDFADFPFSKDVLTGAEPYNFFVFNNGYGFYNANKQGYTWDLEADKLINETEGVNSTDFAKGKALIQSVIADFNSK